MKLRIFTGMDDLVYRVVVHTEDWSEGDLDLMYQFGEPEINVGGTITYSDDGFPDGSADSSFGYKTKDLGDEYVRVFHGFPFMRGFDTRDYGSKEEAVSAGSAWKSEIVKRVTGAVVGLRANSSPIPTEEVSVI